jgi:hypothetical protein
MPDTEPTTATAIGAWSEDPHLFETDPRWPLDGPTITVDPRPGGLLVQVLKPGRPVRIDDYSELSGTDDGHLRSCPATGPHGGSARGVHRAGRFGDRECREPGWSGPVGRGARRCGGSRRRWRRGPRRKRWTHWPRACRCRSRTRVRGPSPWSTRSRRQARARSRSPATPPKRARLMGVNVRSASHLAGVLLGCPQTLVRRSVGSDTSGVCPRAVRPCVHG